METMTFKIRGMNRDLALSKFSPEMAYEIYNMRVLATDSNTSLALTNEKGTKYINTAKIKGAPIGAAVMCNTLYLFTHEEILTSSNYSISKLDDSDLIKEGSKITEKSVSAINNSLNSQVVTDTVLNLTEGRDRIYKIWENDDQIEVENLIDYTLNKTGTDYVDLNLDFEHPLDIIPSYETEDILKLYWVDGKNQARMFNVISKNLTFDFLPEINTFPDIVIVKKDGGGTFPAGVILYCFTMSVDNGLESNIFYTSPLYYITRDKASGLPVGEYSNCSFEIIFGDTDISFFGYFTTLNVYSLLRTNLNGEVICRKVVSLNKDSVLDKVTITRNTTYEKETEYLYGGPLLLETESNIFNQNAIDYLEYNKYEYTSSKDSNYELYQTILYSNTETSGYYVNSAKEIKAIKFWFPQNGFIHKKDNSPDVMCSGIINTYGDNKSPSVQEVSIAQSKYYTTNLLDGGTDDGKNLGLYFNSLWLNLKKVNSEYGTNYITEGNPTVYFNINGIDITENNTDSLLILHFKVRKTTTDTLGYKTFVKVIPLTDTGNYNEETEYYNFEYSIKEILKEEGYEWKDYYRGVLVITPVVILPQISNSKISAYIDVKERGSSEERIVQATDLLYYHTFNNIHYVYWLWKSAGKWGENSGIGLILSILTGGNVPSEESFTVGLFNENGSTVGISVGSNIKFNKGLGYNPYNDIISKKTVFNNIRSFRFLSPSNKEYPIISYEDFNNKYIEDWKKIIDKIVEVKYKDSLLESKLSKSFGYSKDFYSDFLNLGTIDSDIKKDINDSIINYLENAYMTVTEENVYLYNHASLEAGESDTGTSLDYPSTYCTFLNNESFNFLFSFEASRTISTETQSSKIADNIITIIDNHNSELETVDISHLLITCQRKRIIPQTIVSKDSTLFLGNYKVLNNILPNLGDDYLFPELVNNENDWWPINDVIKQRSRSIYNQTTSLNDLNITLSNSSDDLLIFKGGEYYRIGLQGLNSFGEKSEVLDLGYVKIQDTINERSIYTYFPYVELEEKLITTLMNNGYTHVRLMRNSLNNLDSQVVELGVLCPTIFRYDLRISNAPFAMSSWFFRPFGSKASLPYHHYQPLGYYEDKPYSTEIQRDTVQMFKTGSSITIADLGTDWGEEENSKVYVMYIIAELINAQHRSKDAIWISGVIGNCDRATAISLKLKYTTEHPYTLPEIKERLRDIVKDIGTDSVAFLGVPDKNSNDEYYWTNQSSELNTGTSEITEEDGIYIFDHDERTTFIHNGCLNKTAKIMNVSTIWATECERVVNFFKNTMGLEWLADFNLSEYANTKQFGVDYWNSKLNKLNDTGKYTWVYNLRHGYFSGYSLLSAEIYSKIDKLSEISSKRNLSYVVDSSIVTLHGSYNQDSSSISNSSLKLKLKRVGELFDKKSNLSISLETEKHNYSATGKIENWSPDALDIVCAYWGYEDGYEKRTIEKADIYNFIIYPWHRDCCLGNQSNVYSDSVGEDNIGESFGNIYYGKPKTKRLANLRRYLCKDTQTDLDEFTLNDTLYFNGTSYENLLKLKSFSTTSDYNYFKELFLSYLGAVDIVDGGLNVTWNDTKKLGSFISATINYQYNEVQFSGNATKYPILGMSHSDWYSNILSGGSQPKENENWQDVVSSIGSIKVVPEIKVVDNDAKEVGVEYLISSPINIKYLSTPHFICGLGMEDNLICTLPNYTFNDDTGSYKHHYFMSDDIFGKYDKNTQMFKCTSIDGLNVDNGVWVGELIKDISYSYIDKNSVEWVPAGEFVSLVLPLPGDSKYKDNSSYSLEISGTAGGFFLSDYEILKTYSDNTSVNLVYEMLSIPLESPHNLLARTDRNRYSCSTNANPNNFNLFNDVYDLEDNLFNYTNTGIETTEYNNVIIWSLNKYNGETPDSWATMTEVAQVSVDGSNGQLNKLQLWNNLLLAFLDKAINYVPYNERVAIEASDGIPIEIANNNKVGNPMVLTNAVGCLNKWSIFTSDSYLYFIDNYRQGIYRMGGENSTPQCISDVFGFRSWMNKYNSIDIWNPKTFANFKTNYDNINKEVLFINKNYCLAFSELLDTFTSFYSYNNVPFLEKLSDNNYAIKGDYTYNLNTSIWLLWKGDYNSFFGEYKNYSLTVIANDNPFITKVFNTVEYTADVFNKDAYQPNSTFSKLEAWNEYLEGTTNIISIGDTEDYPDFRKKFRVWRVDIPRDNSVEDISNRWDRMSNPWLNIKLTKNTTDDTTKLVLHDIIVNYDIL